MPGFDVPLIGWVALVPLLTVLLAGSGRRTFLLALPFEIVFSIGVHNWYPAIFPPALGYALILAVGMYYAGALHLGVWLYSRLSDARLTRSVSAKSPDFIVWPENEFADVDDARFIDPLKGLAVEMSGFIVRIISARKAVRYEVKQYEGEI